MQKILIFLFVFASFSVFSQVKEVKYYYQDGSVSSEGTMRDGKPDGYWRTYYQDGGLKSEGYRKEFKLDSIWKFYREDSTLEKTITYAEEFKNGKESLYSKEGILTEEFTNKNNIKEGPARYFYDTGELWKTLEFLNNREEGKGTEYDKDGRVITNIVYRNGFIYSEERINRYNSSGKRTGIWREMYPDNKLIKEEGNYTNDLRNGVFKFYNKFGNLDRLEKYENGILVIDEAATTMLDIRNEYHEDGSVKVSGTYREGKKQGNFREYDQEGKMISGALYDKDVKMGEGMIDSLGRRIGPWKLFFPDGNTRSQGKYIDGEKDGPWVYFYENGKQEQKGSYFHDLPTGQWMWFFRSGSVHRDEYYRKGKEDGHAIEYDSIGNIIKEGDFTDGYKTGPWVLTVNDHSEEGEYQDGELNGVWVWKYDNGQKAFQGEYQQGMPVGKHKYWFYNGQIQMTGGYEAGELSGKWDYYNELGLMDMNIEYKEGKTVKINGQRIKLPKPTEEEY